MAVVEAPAAPASGRRRWRTIVFRAIAGLVALLYLAMGGVTSLLVPWFQELASSSTEIQRPGIHYWHDAQFGALFAILLVGSLVALVWRPHERSVLLQFIVLWGALVALAIAPFGPEVLVFLVPIGLVVAAYPSARRLSEVPRSEQVSRPLLALTSVAAALMAHPAWNALQLQLNDKSEHATANHWIIATALSLVLVAAGLMAAGRRPGWVVLGIITGAAFVYLGLVSLNLPDQDGSWGVTGGVLALLGGAAYIITTLWEARRKLNESEKTGNGMSKGIVR